MKHKLFPLFLLLFLLSACDHPIVIDEQRNANEYIAVGVMDVEASSPQHLENIQIDLWLDTLPDGLRNMQVPTIRLYLHRVTFATLMPRIDMIFPTIPSVDVNGGLLFEADTIIPLLKSGDPYRACPVTQIVGVLDTIRQTMQFRCTFSHEKYGDMPAVFEGSLE